MGFDSQHQEFNTGMSLNKSISIWQEHIGLGAQGNMSYASDLSKTFILSLLSVVFPMSTLRYLWVLGNLTLGVVGMYYFLSRSGIFAVQKSRILSLSFFGALFYLFNLGTLQLFYVNFDGFVTQFGFLPWIFLATKNLFEKGSVKNWFIFFLISVISTLQAYTGTLFVAFLVYFSIYLLFLILHGESRKQNLLKALKIGFFLILINMYWIWSIVYFIYKGASFISETSINYFSSEDSFLLNQKYGNILNNLELRGFWFDTNDYFLDRGEFGPLLGVWENHLNQPWNLAIGWFIIAVVVLGFVKTLFDKKLYSFGAFFFLSLFFLSAGNFPFEILFNFLRDYIPLFKEALRFPFTKFSILASFSYSILFSLGILLILEYTQFLLKKYSLQEKFELLVKFKSKLKFVFSLILVFSMFLRFLPYFQGEFINPRMRVTIPEEYFKMFDYFSEKKDQGRVYLSPANTFWAWNYYKWGYRGSGFVGYGIKQPLIDRSFDAMNRENEEVYWETSYGIQKNDPSIIENVFNKYEVKWVIFDYNVIRPGILEGENVNNETLISLLRESELINEYKDFGNIKVVELKGDTNYLRSDTGLGIVSAEDKTHFYDPIFDQQGDYILKNSKFSNVEANVYYPYSFLYSIRGVSEENYIINKGLSDSTLLKLQPYQDGTLSLDKFFTQNNLFRIKYNNESVSRQLEISPLHFGLGVYTFSEIADNSHLFFNNKIKNLIELDNSIIENPTQDLYLLGDETSVNYDFNNFFDSNLNFDTCLGDYEQGNYSYKLEGGTLRLVSSGKNPQICLFGKISNGIFPGNSFVSIDLKGLRESLGNNDIRFCILKNSNRDNCIHDGLLNYENNYSISFYSDSESSDYSLYLYFLGESDRSSKVYEFSTTIKVSYFSKYEIPKLIFSTEVVKASEILDIQLPLSSELNFSNQTYSNLCGDKPIIFNNYDLTYSNKEPKCINLSEKMPFTSHDGVFYLSYRTKNISKKPLICSATKGGCLLSDKLREEEGSYLAPTSKDFSTIRLDLESYSSEESEFFLDRLSLFEFDIDQFGKTYFFRELLESKSSIFTNPNTKVYSWLYYIENPESGFLSLKQGRDPGWVALCDNSPCEMVGYFNSWGMSWKVNDGVRNVILIYWPQLFFFIFIIFNFLVVLFFLFKGVQIPYIIDKSNK
jgi:hypothetical protein